MYLYAVKNSIAKFALAAIAIIGASVLEEIMPKIFGVGAPFLLMAALYASERGRAVDSLLFAIACGAAEDAICNLPAMTSVSYFVFAVIFARRMKMPFMVAALVFPVYQIWLWIWLTGLGNTIFNRVLFAVPVGVVTAVVTVLAGEWLERKAALEK